MQSCLLLADWTIGAGRPCEGKLGYNDIRSGTQVTVTNETRTVLAIGNLRGGIELHLGN